MKIDQKGRSMVEMLGVLAIIGVLSAGGLAGYSKAMFQHRVNQTTDIIMLALQRLMELSQKNLGEDFEIRTAEDIIKYKILENCQKVDSTRCKLPIGSLELWSSKNNSKTHIGFQVNVTTIKECIALASMRWERALPIEWFGYVGVGGDYADVFIYKTGSTPINKTAPTEIANACETACSSNLCYMELSLGIK
ncbi:MAG: type II secretion system protein [Alphaproteobacteria bacterium]|nr:type II secretion system protein [Alphaproteobacteria bacterium]